MKPDWSTITAVSYGCDDPDCDFGGDAKNGTGGRRPTRRGDGPRRVGRSGDVPALELGRQRRGGRMNTARIRAFLIEYPENRGDDDLDTVAGWGFQMPDRTCFIGWNQGAFPDERRFNEPHYSQYGCIEDVRESSQSNLTMLYSEEVDLE